MKYTLMTICAALAISITSCSKLHNNNTPGTSANAGNNSSKSGTGTGSTIDTKKPPIDTSGGGGNDIVTDPNCEGIFCTTEFRMIDLKVTDATGATVLLSSFHTEDMAGNKLPASLYEYDSYRQAYVVFNDSWVLGNQNTTKQVRFVGYKGSIKVVDEVYTIATDCCHIEKTAGKDAVTLP
ncbi:hypothetical protein CAP35_14460 [Chitinophagaceae bacterium IBVUCB1]|nr:hypothetical protein CAP35_14460 [Chitinophagaceae bacterium IBVUCB1]